MDAAERPYVSRRDLVAGLRGVGLESGMHVVVHSSLKRFGVVEDGPHGVIDALEEVITPAGTLVMPTFTSRLRFFLESLHAECLRAGVPGFEGTLGELYARVKAIWLAAGFRIVPFAAPALLWKRFHDEQVFKWAGWTIEPQTPGLPDDARVHVAKDGPPLPPEELHPWRIPCDVGLIPETFWRRPEARRSQHYSGSFAAWGALTDQIIGDHDNYTPHVFEDHPLYRMKEVGGKIILLGINHGNNSTVHVAEQAAVLARGLKNVPDEFLGHFMVLDKPLSERGAQTIGRIGNAEVRLADTRAVYALVADILDGKLRRGELGA